LARELLKDEGSIFVRCDYNGNWIVRPLMNEIFGEENFRNEIIIAKTKEFFKTMTHINKFSEETESLFFFSKTKNLVFNLIFRIKEKPSKYEPFLPVDDKNYEDFRIINGKKYPSPKGRKWGVKQEHIERLIREGRLVYERGKWYLITYMEPLKNVWIDYQGYSRTWEFPTENSEILLKRVIESTSNEGDLVLDFFLGSGTTTAVAHKLRRKWIGIEMGEHFYTVILPRMKKVLAYDGSGISRERDVKEIYNEKNAGGFFKYYELEQYEEILRNVEYNEESNKKNIEYNKERNKRKKFYEKMIENFKDVKFSELNPFLLDRRLAKAVKENEENIEVDFKEIYRDKEVDLLESMANVLGKSWKEVKDINDKGKKVEFYRRILLW
jgi:adenine specific DNA methylase Mod